MKLIDRDLFSMTHCGQQESPLNDYNSLCGLEYNAKTSSNNWIAGIGDFRPGGDLYISSENPFHPGWRILSDQHHQWIVRPRGEYDVWTNLPKYLKCKH